MNCQQVVVDTTCQVRHLFTVRSSIVLASRKIFSVAERKKQIFCANQNSGKLHAHIAHSHTHGHIPHSTHSTPSSPSIHQHHRNHGHQHRRRGRAEDRGGGLAAGLPRSGDHRGDDCRPQLSGIPSFPSSRCGSSGTLAARCRSRAV